jgi:hypothetical protein
MTATPLALAGGSMIFLGFLILTVIVLAFNYYSRTGSGINQRPSDGREAPGAKGASVISTTEEGTERTVGSRGGK